MEGPRQLRQLKVSGEVPLRVKKYTVWLFLYLSLSLFLYLLLGKPSLEGQISLQAYSDALTYETVARAPGGDAYIISAAKNFIGPVLITRLLQFNHDAIYIFNVAIFVFALRVLKRWAQCHNGLLLLLALNPLVMFMLFSVNKEILAFASISCLIAFIASRLSRFLFFAVLLAFLARWEMALYLVLVSFVLFLRINSVRSRTLVFAAMLAAISVVFPMLADLFAVPFERVLIYDDPIAGSGTFLRLTELQSHTFGYILAFFPKAVQLLIGLLARYEQVLNFDDFWNNCIMFFSSFAFLVLLTTIILGKRLSLANDLFFVSLIYLLVFALTPIHSVRYFFPVYVLLSVMLTSRSERFGHGVARASKSDRAVSQSAIRPGIA